MPSASLLRVGVRELLVAGRGAASVGADTGRAAAPNERRAPLAFCQWSLANEWLLAHLEMWRTAAVPP